MLLLAMNCNLTSQCYSNSIPKSPKRCRLCHTSIITSAVRRHLRRRHLRHSPEPHTPAPAIFKLSDNTLQINLKSPLNSLQQFEARINQFVDYSREAFDDLKTVVSVDRDNGGGVVISCKRSTVEFFIAVLLSSLVIIIAFRGLFRARQSGGGGEKLVYRRDRSLGGREVVVSESERNLTTNHKAKRLGWESDDYSYDRRKMIAVRAGERRKEELPQWWPQDLNLNLNSESSENDNKEEYQMMANQLIREIMDRKMRGEDISINDIVQIRHICKSYGVRASINTENARDSLYRVSIKFVLSYCESISNSSTSIQINGEDARDFIVGLAHNIGLENTRAAKMVVAAVAAHTRSKILQAWALEVQNKHSESLVELYKVCLIHRIFPPEERSAEMEMVSQGLEKSLSFEQRESILDSFSSVCGEDMHRSVAEALGLAGAIGNQNA